MRPVHLPRLILIGLGLGGPACEFGTLGMTDGPTTTNPDTLDPTDGPPITSLEPPLSYGSTGGDPPPSTGPMEAGSTDVGPTAAASTWESMTDGSNRTEADTTTDSPEGMSCEPFAQDCPEGFKCAPYASDGGDVWDANKCVPVTGNDTPGQGCTVEVSGTSGYDSCVFGSMCADVDVDKSGICVSLCGGSAQAPTCAPGLACLSTHDGVLNQCVEACVPLSEACSLAAQVCVPGPDDTLFLCVVDAAGGVPHPDEPCAYINECGPGLFCGDPAASSSCQDDVDGCCLRFCDLGLADACPEPLTCVAYFESPPPEYAEVGFCGTGA